MTPRSLLRRSWMAVAAVLFVAGCSGSGAAGDDGQASTTDRIEIVDTQIQTTPPPTEPDTSVSGQNDETNGEQAASSNDLSAIPSTTTPDPLTPLDCTEQPLRIAETLLLQRQRQAPIDVCADGLGELFESQPAAFPCWTTCADGSTFVAFQLNPTVVDTEYLNDDASGFDQGATILYVATYLTADGELVESAETINLVETQPSSTLDAFDITANDLTAQRDTANAALTTYFDALDADDFDAAAELLVGASSVRWEERSDLSRLLQDGLADEQTPEALTAAVAEWCAQGALCRTPDRIDYDITPQHGIRGIAQYDIVSGVIESEFFGGSFEGFQEVRGLPPLP